MGRCHHCAASLDGHERIGFRDACLGCGADLHCCLNCSFFEPGRHNDCREPQAERVVDKARGNFCEYFALGRATSATPSPSKPREQLERLFGRGPK